MNVIAPVPMVCDVVLVLVGALWLMVMRPPLPVVVSVYQVGNSVVAVDSHEVSQITVPLIVHVALFCFTIPP